MARGPVTTIVLVSKLKQVFLFLELPFHIIFFKSVNNFLRHPVHSQTHISTNTQLSDFVGGLISLSRRLFTILLPMNDL